MKEPVWLQPAIKPPNLKLHKALHRHSRYIEPLEGSPLNGSPTKDLCVGILQGYPYPFGLDYQGSCLEFLLMCFFGAL